MHKFLDEVNKKINTLIRIGKKDSSTNKKTSFVPELTIIIPALWNPQDSMKPLWLCDRSL